MTVAAFVIVILVAVLRGAHPTGDYLYEGSHETYPVIDYMRQGNADGKESDPPSFLTSTSNGPRIVEFYAPWCGHCQAFKPKYVALAKEVVAAPGGSVVKFHAVSCQAHQKLCNNQEVHGYPTIKAFKAGEITGDVLKRNELSRAFVLSQFGITVRDEASPVLTKTRTQPKMKPHPDPTVAPGSEKKESAQAVPPPMAVAARSFRDRTRNEIYADAELSFDFALRNSIYMEMAPLSTKEKDAFAEWLGLLQRTLPRHLRRVHEQIHTIQSRFNEATHQEKNLLAVVGAKPENTLWKTCTYGDNSSGYTCGLWELFHIMSVGISENADKPPRISTRKASEILRNYIEHFFACDICRINYLQMHDSCANGLCDRLTDNTSTTTQSDWRQLALWLWETHNNINLRLMKERAERDKRPKPTRNDEQAALWPSTAQCPRCWRRDGSWDEGAVYDFLRSEYWPDGEVSRDMQQTEEKQPSIPKAQHLFLAAAGLWGMMWSLWLVIKKRKKQSEGMHKKIDDSWHKI